MCQNIADLLELGEDEFREKFKGSAVKRAKWRGLIRNAMACRTRLVPNDEPDL